MRYRILVKIITELEKNTKHPVCVLIVSTKNHQPWGLEGTRC